MVSDFFKRLLLASDFFECGEKVPTTGILPISLENTEAKIGIHMIFLRSYCNDSMFGFITRPSDVNKTFGGV